MCKIYTIEGNTSAGSTLVANGGCVAQKSYDLTYNRIAKIWRPKYKSNEASKVIKMAQRYVGYMEKASNNNLNSFTANVGYNNYTIFAKLYEQYTNINVQGQPWCDVFVDMMFILALGVDRAKELLGGWSAYTPTSSNLLKYAAKKEVKNFNNVKKGDIIFFANSLRICHTGLIRSGVNPISPGSNADSTYSYSKFMVDMQKVIGSSTTDPHQMLGKTVTISTKKNTKHPMVMPLQKYLKYLGYYTGVCDCYCGTLTEQAINKYQTDILKYSKPDGEVTQKGKMWRTLLRAN